MTKKSLIKKTTTKVITEESSQSLTSITKQINSRIKKTLKSAIDIGALLESARHQHFENTKDWMEWAEKEFNLKRASVLSYLQISSTFTGELAEKFEEIGIRAAGSLMRNADMLQDASLAISEGLPIDNAWINDWKSGNVPPLLDHTPPKEKGDEGTGKGKGEGEGEGEGEFLPKEKTSTESLMEEIALLKEEALMLEHQVMSKYFKKVLAYMKGKEDHQILGLEYGCTNAKIKKAKRELSKLYATAGKENKVLVLINAAAERLTDITIGVDSKK